ncbi:hypothetical protein [Hyphomicrobium denitrificans]|uniref:hypothetical protein n=1 Tax=Hyphomicrobium denitrificans TaxID=53399 RepID=UPI0002E89DFF|nr:hypothetical protein [Hyphomicrobium denitrificans]
MEFETAIKLKSLDGFPSELRTVGDARTFFEAHVKTLPATQDSLAWRTAGSAIENSRDPWHIRRAVAHALADAGWIEGE